MKKTVFPCSRLLLPAFLIQQLLSYPAYSITIDYDGTDTSLLRPDPRGYTSVKNSFYPGSNSFNGNAVNVSGGTLVNVFGGVSSNANPFVTDTGNGTQDITGNTVNFSGGTASYGIYGGYSINGNGTGNTVNFSGGTVGNRIVGSQTMYGNANENIINFSGGTVNNSAVYSGYSVAGNNAVGNIVTISGGTISNSRITGGLSNVSANGNTVAISGGNISTSQIYGGNSDSAIGNTVTISNGNISNSRIFGGYTYSNDASGNSITISGGTATDSTIYAGWSSTGAATGNAVILKNAPDISGSTLYGGYTSPLGTSRDNTLEVWTKGLSARNVRYFQNYEFILPDGTQNGDTVLNLSDSGGTDLSNTKVGVAIASGARVALQAGDRVHLITNANGVTSTGVTQTSMTGRQGISLQYDFGLESGSTWLDAVLKNIRTDPAVGIFNNGRTATLGFVNQGTDFALDQNLECSVNEDGTVDRFCLYGAVGGSDLRYDMGGEGAHGTTSGTHWVLGLRGKLESEKDYELTGAIFTEAGWGNLDERNHYAKGSGDTHYYGIGATGQYRKKEGLLRGSYAQVNAKTGRVSTDFDSNLRDANGTQAGYDKTATYYGAGLKAGYQWDINSNYLLDTYMGYQWMHIKGFDASIAGDPYRFEDINSHRTRLGARLEYRNNEQYRPYIGLAWEHEFSGNARGTAYGYEIDKTSLKGDTGIGEIGVRFSPAEKSPWTVDVAVRGYVGQREGAMGNLVINYKF